MSYPFCPPEINSTKMYAGPGASSMLAAAGSWDAVSAELGTTAQTCESVIESLTSLEWQGPASEAMTASAARYIRWLQMAAEQTKQTAMHARTVAAAYEQAHSMTIPPMAVMANRVQHARLIATNIMGQNTALIAQYDAQYADYWAQDVTAMSNYDATAKSATTQLPKFNSPNNSTNQSGLAAQSSSVAAANGTAAASTSVSQALSQVTNAAAAPAAAPLAAAANPITSALGNIPLVPADLDILDVIAATGVGINSTYNCEAFAAGVIGAENNLGILPDLGAAAAAPVEAPLPEHAAAAPLGGGAGLGSVAVSVAGGNTIGPMSVPAGWAGPSTTQVAALQPAGMTTIPGTEEAAAASGYPGYPGMPGAVGSRGMGVGAPPRYGVKLTVMPRPPAAG